MEITDLYQRLNQGKIIRKKDITRDHIVKYDSDIFWKTIFYDELLTEDSKTRSFIDNFREQIIVSEKYLKDLLYFGNRDGFSNEQLQPISKDHKTLCSHLLDIPRKDTEGTYCRRYIPKRSEHKACNGF